jgi:NAD(P)-dependent dehydrogenase (short-subunit alcohol dehydrogenase family)
MDNKRIDPFSLEGKSFLVTGASSGIGKAVSILTSQMGASLLLVDINEKGLQETKAACTGKVETATLDLTDSETVGKNLFAAIRGFGTLNGLIHLAGVPYISPLKSISEEKINRTFRINTYSALELCKIFINKNVFAGGVGSIVLISSVYAVVGSAGNVGYAMSKAALHGITKSLAIELAPRNIRVNCIAPGFVRTKMMSNTKTYFDDSHTDQVVNLHPLGLGEAEDVAYAAIYMLSDAAKWVTGAILNVDGGFTAQ